MFVIQLVTDEGNIAVCQHKLQAQTLLLVLVVWY